MLDGLTSRTGPAPAAVREQLSKCSVVSDALSRMRRARASVTAKLFAFAVRLFLQCSTVE